MYLQMFVMKTMENYMAITHRIHGAAIYGNIYHQYTPNVSIYTIHGSYGYGKLYGHNSIVFTYIKYGVPNTFDFE